MKKLIIAVIMVITLALGISINPVITEGKSKKQDSLQIKVYEPDKLTLKMLTNRKSNVLIIERCVGVVTNNKRDGKILNTKSKNNYINYRRVNGAKKGDKIVSYFLYNPYSQYDDDIICRIDEIIK